MTNNWFEGKNPQWTVKAHFLILTFKLSFFKRLTQLLVQYRIY